MVLLLGITIVATGAILAVGATVIDDSKQMSRVDSAEHAMTQFDSRVSLVGLEGSGRQRATLPGGEGTDVAVDGDAGWMRIDVYSYNTTNGSTTFDYTLMNESMGAVRYENGETVVAYQGGGVWERTPAGSRMVSPPEFHYRGTTLTLPLVTVNESGTVSGEVLVSKNETTAQYPVDGNATRTNPLSSAVVNITVKSQFYRAWGQFFVERTGGNVSYDHADQTVSLLVKTPTRRQAVSSAVASTSSGTMVIQGSGGSSFTDSYNSSNGDYAATASDNGTIVTAGGVDMGGGAEIRGNLVSGSGSVSMNGASTRVTGNVSYGGSLSAGSATIEGWTAPNATVDEVAPVGGLVDEEKQRIRTGNHDNNNVSAIDNATDQLVSCDPECTLPAGEYYLDEIDLGSGDTLELDLSGGDVVIAVENGINLDGATVDVDDVSGGTVKIYMDGNTLDVTGGATVNVANDAASNLWIFGPPDTSVTVTNSGTEFVGAVYAPESPGQSGSVDVTAGGEVYGAVVGGETTLQSGGTIHFDQALRHDQPLTGSRTVRVTYLHISVNSVNISDV